MSLSHLGPPRRDLEGVRGRVGGAEAAFRECMTSKKVAEAGVAGCGSLQKGSYAGLIRLKGIARGRLGGLIAMVAMVRKSPRRLF